MNLSSLVNIAEIISGLGVIASLIFVAIKLRKNNKQSKIDTWSNEVNRVVDIYGRASDITLGNIIAKERKNYYELTDGEKISFGHHLEQLCIALEAMLHGENIHGAGESKILFDKHIQFHLGCPGGKILKMREAFRHLLRKIWNLH